MQRCGQKPAASGQDFATVASARSETAWSRLYGSSTYQLLTDLRIDYKQRGSTQPCYRSRVAQIHTAPLERAMEPREARAV